MPDQNPNQPNSNPQNIPPQGVNVVPTTHSSLLTTQSEPAIPASPTGFQDVSSSPQPGVAPVQPLPPQNISRSPLKKILITVGIIILVGILGFFVWKTFFYKPVSQVAHITYWGFRDNTPGLQTLISQYESQNPLVKIDYVKQSKEDYRERLASSFAQSKAPDIFEIHNTWLPMFSGQLSTLPADIMDKNTYSNTFYPTTFNDLTQNGNIYAIPANFDGLALFINQSIFDESGKTPPITWDELRQTAHDLTIVDKDEKIQQAGIALGRTDNVDHWQDILSLLMLQVGVDPARPTGKLAEDTLNYFLIFAGEDHDWDESLPPSTKAFADGKSAMYLGPAYEIDTIKKINPNLSFKVFKAPQLAKDDPKIPNINWATYWVNSVWSKSKNSQESWKFINYLSQKSSLEKLNQEDVVSGVIGEIYPRSDMADQFSADPYLGAFYAQAPSSKSWYMAPGTYDGATGINSKIASYYVTAINGILTDRRDSKEVLGVVASGVSQVLSGYKTVSK